VEPDAPTIRPLEERELSHAVSLLARAFQDNPLNRAVIQGDSARRLRSNRYGMRASLEASWPVATHLGAFAGGRLRGALIAAAPGTLPFPLPTPWQQLRCLWGQGWATARRWSELHEALSGGHPPGSHAYLDLLGVEPGAQRQGLGRALLSAWHQQVDAEGAASYLETDRERNLAFYSGVGYRVLGEEKLLGVRIWRLWRDEKKTAAVTETSAPLAALLA